ncbi:MAG: cytochrome c biogenesis protein ResB [Mailhella sp.]|nr:cytochrome c biogenesis protein ResB [Mailhella sp.]
MTLSKTSLAALAGGIALAACQWMIFAWAPEEKVMGPAQKIFYIHLPLAWWGLVSFAAACMASILYLWRKKPSCDQFSAAAVEIGLLFCTAAPQNIYNILRHSKRPAAKCICAGLMLELSVGPVVWEAFAWPANGIVLAGFLAIIAAIFLLRNKVYACRFIGTYQAAIPTLVYAVGLTIIMGLTRQTVNGTWLNNMLTFWPFVLTYVYMAVILGVVILRRLRDIPFLLNHLGLFLAMTTATLGNADMQRLKMITTVGESEWRALTQEGAVREMPLAIELKQFIMETYDDGSPKRFASEIQILTKSGKKIQATVDVNKPIEVDGWKIYQYGYDTQMGAMSQYSILELVSDPWLPLVYTGIYMMLAGAVCMFLKGKKVKR